MKTTLAVLFATFMLASTPAPADVYADVPWLDIGPGANWDTPSFSASTWVVIGRTWGENSFYVWQDAYDKRTRYECAGYTRLAPGQFVQDPTFSVAILDVPDAYCGPTRIVWTSTSAPYGVPWFNLFNSFSYANSNYRDHALTYAGTGFGRPAQASGNMGYRQLGQSQSASTGAFAEVVVLATLE